LSFFFILIGFHLFSSLSFIIKLSYFTIETHIYTKSDYGKLLMMEASGSFRVKD